MLWVWLGIAPLAAAENASSAPKILVLGDSLSAGYGIDANRGWVALLETTLQEQGQDYRVINAGISGDTTRGGLARLPARLDRERPEIVILQLGANDGLRGMSLDQMKDNLRRMIALSREHGAKVLLLGVHLPTNYGAYGQRFHRVYGELAAETAVALVPFFLAGVAETPDLMLADGIHPNAAAQPRILRNVLAGLRPLLEIP